MVKLIAVQGNIGAGKTTYIQSHYADAIQLTENLDYWNLLFNDYYKIISSKKSSYSLEEQCVVAAFQLMTAITRLQQYNMIDYSSDKTYVFERTIQESLDVFLPTLRKYIQNDDIYYTIYDLQHELCLLEPTFDECIKLHAEVPELMSRIEKRNRNGEIIDVDYLYELQNRYENFQQRNNHQQPFKNQQYVIGGIGAGKTTFINTLKTVGLNVVPEPINYWNLNGMMQKHLVNLKSVSKPSIWSFIFQLRVIASRLKFRYDNCMYERNICEEYYVFINSYKHAFTDIQFKLLKDLYKLLIPHFQQGKFYYITTDAQKQYNNIQQRARDGEEVYTIEHIKKVDALYKDMIKTLGLELYYISY